MYKLIVFILMMPFAVMANDKDTCTQHIKTQISVYEAMLNTKSAERNPKDTQRFLDSLYDLKKRYKCYEQ